MSSSASSRHIPLRSARYRRHCENDNQSSTEGLCLEKTEAPGKTRACLMQVQRSDFSGNPCSCEQRTRVNWSTTSAVKTHLDARVKHSTKSLSSNESNLQELVLSMNVNLNINTSLNAVSLDENTAYQAFMDNVSGQLLDCMLLSVQINRLLIKKEDCRLSWNKHYFITNNIS